MKVSQAENRLTQLLKENGFDINHPDPRLGWEAFKQFVREPVKCAEDTIAFQMGVNQRTGIEQCYFDFVRRFEINDEEKYYDHMEHVHLLFLANPTDELRRYQTCLSNVSRRFPTLEAFFAAVESLPAFRAGVAHSPWRCRVEVSR